MLSNVGNGAGMKYLFHYIVILGFIFLCPALANSQVIPQYTIQQYNDIVEQLYKNPQTKSTDVTTRVAIDSKFFLGKNYLQGALGEGPNAEFDQSPLYRTDAFDCTTYVSTVLALVEGKNLQQFKNNIKKINYHDKKISYLTRNHFIEVDWNTKNQKNGYLIDITDSIGNHVAQIATAVIDKPAWYRMKNADSIKYLNLISSDQTQSLLEKLHHFSFAMKNQTATISYLPLQKLFNADGTSNEKLFNQIPSGSVIEMIGPNWSLQPLIGTDLLVIHMGIVIRDSRGLMFREASSEKGKVIELPLVDYLRSYLNKPFRVKGMNIQKIVCVHCSL